MATTKGSDNRFPLLRLTYEDDTPATPPADEGHIVVGVDKVPRFIDDDGVLTELGGSAATADHDHTTAGGDGGDLDGARVGDFLEFTEASAPSSPASGFARLYAKSDGRIYSKDDGGTEYGPFDAAGGGGGPLLYVDTIALDAAGDEFTDDTLPGWTKVGSGTATEITTEPYDATCIDLQFSAQSDRIYKAIDSGDWTYYLSLYGVTNATPSPTTALNGMLALVATDDAGDGTGVSLYNDGQGYMWGVVANAYNASGAVVVSNGGGGGGYLGVVPPAAANWPIVYRLAKASGIITGGISFDGGLTYRTNTRADATTFTRIGVTRLFSSGGTNPTLRLGRFNLVP
jgi:hypothetical protein